MIDEKLLLKQVVQGNERAFKALYEHYFTKIFNFVVKICKSDEIAQEIVQNIFLTIWVNREALSSVNSFNSYIFSIAHNKAIDFVRRLTKEAHIIQILAIENERCHNPVEDYLNRADLQKLIETALNSLSAQKNEVFRLSKFEGCTHDEIASIMQLSKSTVKNHLSETLKVLRNFINNKYNEHFILAFLFYLLFLKK